MSSYTKASVEARGVELMHKTANYKVLWINYWLPIVGMHPGDHIVHTFLSYSLSFPSLSPVTSLITPTNDGPVLMDFMFGI